MKTALRIQNRESHIEWDQDGETFHFRFESQEERTAHVLEVEPRTYSVLIGGRSYEAKTERRADGLFIVIGGWRIPVEICDPRQWNGKSKSGPAGGREEISAPMPGKVVRVLVCQGDRVEAQQGVAVVEAMKMQNELKSSRAGTVTRVAVAAGATVNPGEVLVVIE
jgi:biotin carboxyl carrier protein